MTWSLVRNLGTTLINPDGSVRSLNPDAATPPTTYHWEARAPGSQGAYELMAVDGSMVAYNPLGTQPVIFGFKATAPNAAGWSAITEEPLS